MKKKSTEEIVKELLEYFLRQDVVRKVESSDKNIKIYKVGDNLVRVDIKIQ